MSLSLHYDSAEPNSAWNWLDRWSLSQFWKPSANPRKVSNKMPRRKQRGPQIVENEAGKAKRSIRKASTASNGDNGALASFEMDKPKRNSKKVTSHQSAENQPQNELERVKCGLRNVSASVAVASEKSEMELEKPLQQLSVGTVLKSAKSDVSEQEMVISAENTDDGQIDKRASLEGPSTTMSIDEPFDDQPQKMETTIFKEKSNSLEDERMRKRRSLPAKQEYPENISLNTPRLPSYMVATESAKAKLRASKLSEDGEEPGYVRRHSLPASSNGKLSSVSARTREPKQTNGKGSNKTNRSMMSSRDGNLVHQMN